MDRLKLIETFAVVVRSGSYTKAAKELGVTRAMVSKRIQDLETLLDTRLLHRDTHSLGPTSLGTDYYQGCLTLLTNLRDLDERVNAKHATPHGEIRILTTRTFGETILGPVITEFCGLYPQVSIHMTLADRETSPRTTDLHSGDFDIAVRTLAPGDTTLVARPISGFPRILVAAPAYLERCGYPKRPTDLAHHNCLDPSGAVQSTWEFQNARRKTKVRVSGTPRANSSLVVRDAAIAGLGIAILRQYLINTELADRKLVRILSNQVIEERTLHIVYPRDKRQPLRMKMLIRHLSDRIPAQLNQKLGRNPGHS